MNLRCLCPSFRLTHHYKLLFFNEPTNAQLTDIYYFNVAYYTARCSSDGGGRGVYMILVEKPEGKRPLGRLRCNGMTVIHSILSLIRHLWRSIGTISSESSGLIKDSGPAAPKHVGARLIF
jgi:hypothetical protein